MKKAKADKKLILVVGILLVFGSIMIFSSSWPYALDIGASADYFFKRHILFATAGFIAMILVSFIDYHIYQKYAVQLYILTFAICLLVFTPLGNNLDTFARRWIVVGPINFMPSDLMKIASVILLTSLLSMKRRRDTVLKDILPVILIIIFSVLPVYLQPNLSTSITIILSLGAIYFISGMDLRYFFFIIPSFVLMILMFFLGEKNEYRRRRLYTLLHPLEDYTGDGWQLSQALVAVSTGGLLGVGFGKSRQKHLYLSEAHNDFVFAIISEELGFLGAAFVIILFLILIRIGFKIAVNAKDDFGRLLAAGITLVIGIQAFINIGVSFGLLPPTGLVLPFISYGGTSLMVTLGMVGILLNISRNKTIIKE
ncbi:MAG: putative lipid II flippase FtsW [Tissierellia bacterium]|nr:putative lipid II flippase FtsW [Tissierellia bacterium]